MYRMTALIFSSVLIWSSLFAQADDKRPMTVDDRLGFVEIGNVLLSPDGGLGILFKNRTRLETEREEKPRITWCLQTEVKQSNILGMQVENHFSFHRMENIYRLFVQWMMKDSYFSCQHPVVRQFNTQIIKAA